MSASYRNGVPAAGQPVTDRRVELVADQIAAVLLPRLGLTWRWRLALAAFAVVLVLVLRRQGGLAALAVALWRVGASGRRRAEAVDRRRLTGCPEDWK